MSAEPGALAAALQAGGSAGDLSPLELGLIIALALTALALVLVMALYVAKVKATRKTPAKMVSMTSAHVVAKTPPSAHVIGGLSSADSSLSNI